MHSTIASKLNVLGLLRSGDGGGSNWWEVSGKTCVAAYQPKGAASLAASYSNLANPGTYDAAPGTAPTWDSTNGWKFAGASSQYLDSGVSPLDGYSMFVRFSNLTAHGNCLAGVLDGGVRFYFYDNLNAPQEPQYAYGNAIVDSTAGTEYTAGVLGITDAYGYRGGAEDGTLTHTWSGTPRSIFIGALRDGSSANYHSTAYIQAFAIYSDSLTSAQALALSTVMAAL